MALTPEDHVEIQGLVARYSHAVDGGDGDAFAAAFTEDGVLEAGELLVEGRAALQQFAARLPQAYRLPRHVTTNLVIDGDEHRAATAAYVQMYVLAGDPPRQEISASGRYHDELVKLDGHWVFARRTFTRDA